MEKLDFLIKYLLDERNEKVNLDTLSFDSKKRLFRSLCNIREAKEISDEFIATQDEFLQSQRQVNKIAKSKSQIQLWKGDITTLEVEAIVNAANSKGLGCFIPCHGCIDNAIHSASGIQLRSECGKKMEEIKILKTGEAFLTDAYNLPSKYIIHTVGPIIAGEVSKKEINQLRSCYTSCLDLAKENNITEIAFCSISTGEFRFPKEKACKIAISTVKEYLKENSQYFDRIIFNVFSDEEYEIYAKNLGNEYGRL